MLPFESNILIVVFIFAAVLAYIFILRKLKPEMRILKQVTKETQTPNPNRNNNKPSRESKKNSVKQTQAKPNLKPDDSCWHGFGYLGTLPKNSKIPDECLGCSRIVKCLAEGRSR